MVRFPEVLSIAGGPTCPEPLAGVVIASLPANAEVVLADRDVITQAFGAGHCISRKAWLGFLISTFAGRF